MDAEVIEIVDNSQQDSVDDNNLNNPSQTQTKEENKKRKICPLFIPKGKKQGIPDEKDSIKQATKSNKRKRESAKRLKKPSKPIDIVDCVNDCNQVENPIQSQKRPKEKDIMSTPDMFLTKTEREEKKRRLQVKRESEMPTVSKSEEPPKHQKVYSIFQKTSVRKQQLIEQADTSFRDVITWNQSVFPKYHFFLPQSNHFQLSPSEKTFFLQDASSTPIDIPVYFQGNLPVVSQHIEEIIDVEDFNQELFPPIKQYLAQPKVQTILNTFSKNDADIKLRAITYLQNLYPIAIHNRGSMWIDCCRKGGKEMIWEMNELSQGLINWLSSFKEINFDDDDDDGNIVNKDRHSNNSYIIAGYEGKTSLVYHLANTLDYKVIEVNNTDQAIANIVNSLQEATQSRVIKGQSFPLKKRSSISKKHEKETFTKCPVILIDDLDVNVPSSQSFNPSSEGISIGDLSSMDLYTRYSEKSSQLKQGYLKSIKQLIQGSKCPIIITSSYLTVDIESLSPQLLFIPKPEPSSVVLHAAVITLAFTPSIPPELIFDVCLQSRYDCRQSINLLQFISSFPSITSSRCYSSLLHWPYEWNKEKQTVLSNTSFDGWDDDNLDYFMYSNYLSFFTKNNPARSHTPASIPTITINAVSPAIVPQEGGDVTIKGKDFSKVSEVFLVGSAEGCVTISFEKTDIQIHAHIPALPRGLYNFLFYTKDGCQLVNSGHQQWFGSSSILVSPLLHQTTVNSEDEFEENHPTTKWKKGKSPVVLLSDLFTEQELLFEEEGKKIVNEESKKELGVSSKEESESESESEITINEVRTEKELEIANELTALADSYDILICETQLQHPTCSFCDCRDDENCVNGVYYHPTFYGRQKKMALDMTLTLYQSTLRCDNTFMKMPSLASREKEIMLSYYQEKKWGGIVEFLVKVPSLSYLLLKRNYMDYLNSVLTIQQISRCDRNAKDFSRRGQQVYPNVERMLCTADRTLCSQFVEFFCNWADYDSLCSEEEVNTFWKGL